MLCRRCYPHGGSSPRATEENADVQSESNVSIGSLPRAAEENADIQSESNVNNSGRRCSFRARQEREKETRVPLIRCDPRSGSPFRPPSPVLNKGTKGCLSGIGLVPYSTTLISNINTRLRVQRFQRKTYRV